MLTYGIGTKIVHVLKVFLYYLHALKIPKYLHIKQFIYIHNNWWVALCLANCYKGRDILCNRLFTSSFPCILCPICVDSYTNLTQYMGHAVLLVTLETRLI